MKTWLEPTGTLIGAIGSEHFAGRLSDALKQIVPFDYTVVFGYQGAARPQDLFDNFPEQKRKIFVEDYQAGPYLLDPFYQACANEVKPGLYRLRDLAPDRFYQGEYYRNYYQQTGLAEEIAYFIELRGDAVITVSLMRTSKPFSAREIRELKQYWPIVREACRQHWQDLSPYSDQPGNSNTDANMHQTVELALLKFGEGVLTPREREVVEFTLKGHSAEAVGRIMKISQGTVRIHRRNIYSKLRIRSQGELFSKFMRTLTEENDDTETPGVSDI
ncbi:LuxR C-terminal-related transcriptional regulator [Candidatus Halocynthiibacter alkanivorans]|uniref:LuxR C-terminal-related transcriptional regulator n=1 Tax=Candidatus Halocynthiibacter alkanivorans TaxID=2267619 RepID=UPI000DF15800|nr:LuxR family transcriptional regulator [Candidatus Halocynthiibacter alkanivorans]